MHAAAHDLIYRAALGRHCRGCGQILCHACSSQKSPIPQLNITRKVRVCDVCYDAAKRRAQLLGLH
jgi:hypothetical protein